MKSLVPAGKRGAADPLYELTEHFDVRARRNGLIVGSVRFSFWNGQHYCIALQLHNGMPAWGEAASEFAPFRLHEGEAPWLAPVVQPAPKPPASDLLTPTSTSAMPLLAAPTKPSR